MDRRHLLALLVTLVALGTRFATLAGPAPTASGPPSADRQYPEGAGPDHIDFAVLDADDGNVSRPPRQHWDAYAVVYTASPERPVAGDYYINATTGEGVTERRHDATVYRNGTTYAFAQPADSIPEHRREQFEADDSFVSDDTTDAYYRYDPHYGRIAPTTLGRHTDVLESYTWEAVDTTTHHGVPVLTYRVTGTRTNSSVPSATSGTLQLGVEDGVVYAFDATLDGDGRSYHYTYTVRPAPFPDHDRVDTARDVAASNATAASRSDHRTAHTT